jgi:predicted metallo-beta-lactamase superfamily hydrolase
MAMRVMPLAADSLGARSMATYVEAGPLRLLIDPGATLAPRRYGLGPAPEEEEALARARLRIEGYAVRATHVAVSHFHADHFGADPGLYAGREVWAKDPRRMTDRHQAAQGREFWRAVGSGCRLETAEGRHVELGDVTVRFSPPLPHGPDGSEFGHVVAVTVDDGTRFVHASDLQGPASPVATAFLLRERPDLVYLSGPPTYLQGQVGHDVLERGIDNLVRLVERTGCRVIVDHHAVREPRFRDRLARAFDTGRVVTAAGYLGRPDECLEAWRATLWARRRRERPDAREAAGAP